MKTKAMKLCSLLMALLAMTFLLTACGGSGADESESSISQQDSQQEDNGADVDESVELDFWVGEYANDNGTLTIDNSGGTLYYALSYIGEDGTSVASGTLSESGDPYVLEESDFIFSYDDSDQSIEITLQATMSIIPAGITMSVRWGDLTLQKAMQRLMWRIRTASMRGTANMPTTRARSRLQIPWRTWSTTH